MKKGIKHNIIGPLFAVAVFLLALSMVSPSGFAAEAPEQTSYTPNEVLIQFKESSLDVQGDNGERLVREYLEEKSKTLTPVIINKLSESNKLMESEITPEELDNLKDSLISLDHNFGSANGSLLRIATNDSVLEIVEELKKDPRIEMVTPNYKVKLDTTPSETDYSGGVLWGLYNDGTEEFDPAFYDTNNPGTAGIDIDAAAAWDLTTGSSSVIVAVMDSGIDYDHSDLAGNMWDGSSCVDEYGNSIEGGCDHHGWNYIDDNDETMDDVGHGTYVAGIVGATQGDGGVVGVNWNVGIMAIKIDDDASNIIDGIDFANENGAHIINASWTLGADPANLEDTIERFVNYGGLFVTSAGNDRSNLDSIAAYPNEYDLDGADYDNLITVAATDQADEAWDEGVGNDGTNFGDEEVDLGAPGANIKSTYWISGQSDQYFLSGATSAATPFVSGTAALLKAHRSELTAQQVKLAIMESGDDVDDLNPSTGDYPTVTGKRLNAYKALLAADKALVIPTITSTVGGGNWNSTSTWEGGVVPTSTDVVEINGTVTLNTSPTIAGLLVNSGKILRTASSGSYTLTLSGANADLEINGSLTNYSSGYMILNIGGNLENNGTMSTNVAYVDGNVINTSTVSNTIYVKGDVTNSGSMGASLTFNGSATQTLTSNSGTFGNLYLLSNNVNAYGDIDASGTITINSGYTLTLDSDDTLYLGGNLTNYGTIACDTLVLDGTAQNISQAGTYNVNNMVLGGSDIKTLSAGISLSGNLTINSGVTLKPAGGRTTYTATIGGDFTNNGSTSEPIGYHYGYLKLTVSGNSVNNGTLANHYLYTYQDLDNNGTMTVNAVFADWEPVEGADSYDFQYTDTSAEWQSEVSTGTSTQYNITTYVNDDRRWRWRSVEDSTPSAWSEDKYIN